MTLLVSIHDVAPPHLAAVERVRDLLTRWGVHRVTLLAIPDHHRTSPLGRLSATMRWLRHRAAAGDEVALHGFTHQAERAPGDVWSRVRCALFTAGEGECLGLDEEEALLRLEAGRDVVEDGLGRRVAGFVAPAWLEPPGFAGVLARLGFGWHETAWRLERLAPRTTLRGPVIGFATRSLARRLAAVAWARGLMPVVDRVAVARVALHPGDVTSPMVLASAERVIRRLVATRRPVTTSEALGLAA